MELIISDCQECDECHRKARRCVDVGRVDARGHYLQESGARICSDCLTAACGLVIRSFIATDDDDDPLLGSDEAFFAAEYRRGRPGVAGPAEGGAS